MAQNWVLAGLIVMTALVMAVIPQLLARIRLRHNRAQAEAEAAARQTVFLFEGDRLIDATPAALDLLGGLPPAASDWSRLVAYLAPRFPQALADLGGAGQGAQVFVGADAGGAARLRLNLDRRDDRLRVTLTAVGAQPAADLARLAQDDDTDRLRTMIEAAPILSWRETGQGQVIWANAAYRALVLGPDDAHPWPLPTLFAPFDAQAMPRQQALGDTAAKGRWFDLHDGPDTGDRLRFAIPADAAVRAEGQLREFVQTLSKTFADLPIGLAVFDRQRRLQVFNPALTDLTTLGAAFLSARPSFEDFLDRLREARMMPEPKDYRGWRQRLVTLEAAAAAGYHCETWSLPGGQTYRVTGRPHPGGAIAFLIEDISTAMRLTRQFRAEIDLGREILDHLDLPLCVISREGGVVTANAAARALVPALAGDHAQWAVLADCAQPDARDALGAAIGAHANWHGVLTFPGHRQVTAQAGPIAGGMLLVQLTPLPAATPPMGAAARQARAMAAVARRRVQAPSPAPEALAQPDIAKPDAALADTALASAGFAEAAPGFPFRSPAMVMRPQTTA
ncbi:PAS-domain containing protein [Paracoccus sp. p4-l81]|uniref:PAS-domain containing protein n=1 Tax=unclassified Paracoccus (in: a-proteobacteria) TaxID=2688777 RepID=UPI0035B7C26D